MKRTHYSLHYLIGYLVPGGLALLVAVGPGLFIRFMTFTGYDNSPYVYT